MSLKLFLDTTVNFDDVSGDDVAKDDTKEGGDEMAQFLHMRKTEQKKKLNQWRAAVLVLECYIGVLCDTAEYQKEHHLGLRNQARTLSQALKDRANGKAQFKVRAQ